MSVHSGDQCVCYSHCIIKTVVFFRWKEGPVRCEESFFFHFLEQIVQVVVVYGRSALSLSQVLKEEEEEEQRGRR